MVLVLNSGTRLALLLMWASCVVTALQLASDYSRGCNCPPLKLGHDGICINDCHSDKECGHGFSCCFNGCGWMCKRSPKALGQDKPVPVDGHPN
ncbi:waprin-Thr1-like [Oratosquilla oratoria]|uniref:waprin-Thr1-like n=1 Tax=Oratosquilla oratoria TaxID=337810 RepID=UPI003F763DB4